MASPLASTSRMTLSTVHQGASAPPLLPHWARSSSSSTASSATTPPRPPTTHRRGTAASKRLSSRPGSNLVGPADPLSNLRPVIYGSAFQTDVIGDVNGGIGKKSIAATNSSAPSTHPYSTSEFNSLPILSTGMTGPFSSPPPSSSITSTNPSWTSSRSAYQTNLLHRLEAAELAHHLRRARSDRFSQDFWEDNNRRFTSALEQYRRGVHIDSSDSVPSSVANPPGKRDAASSDIGTTRGRSNLKPSEDLLSPFYSAWLSANAKRHQAYNERLWAMTKEDLIPAANYALLRAWTTFVVRVEARMKRWWG